MECFLVFAALVIFVTVLIAISSRKQGRARRRDSIFEQVAGRFHGVCRRGGWFGQPSVRFRYGQTMVLLESAPDAEGDGGLVTQVHLRWPDPAFCCEIAPRRDASRMQYVGLPVVSVDHDNFDRQFVARANHDEQLRRFVSAGVQWQLQRLRQAGGPAPVLVAVGQGHLSVRKYLRFTQYADLDEFLATALELFDQALLSQSVGIEFVGEQEAQIVQQAVCKICGEDILEDLVYCRRCKTPHHRECWQYYGSCSTYGCREQRFAVPAVAKPAESERTEAKPPP